ncbi:PilW family protein [Magnetococcales bacterium HHB-1]
MKRQQINHDFSKGFSLVELMISMTIGLFLVLGLTTLYVRYDRSHREIEKTGQLIENGRFSMEILYQDIRHAGFYGVYPGPEEYDTFAIPPDPCNTSDADILYDGLSFPLQAYRAADALSTPNLSDTTCSTLLPSSNLVAGSDILVIRRAETATLTNSPTTNEVYLQANTQAGEIQFGFAEADLATQGADGSTATLYKKDGTTPADIRKLHVHIYFVAPCSEGTGYDGLCSGDDDEDSIPTLKRLELTSFDSTTIMQITPISEGVEYLKFRYGIDDTPSEENEFTGLPGDGAIDRYSTTLLTQEWYSVISITPYVLVRTTQEESGHQDQKSYTVGDLLISSPNDGFRRRLFSAEIRLNNLAGRREGI